MASCYTYFRISKFSSRLNNLLWEKYWVLSFAKQRDTSLWTASGLKFLHNDHNKDNDWIFDLNEICTSNTNQTIQWPIAFSVCRARFCCKQNTHFNEEVRRQCIKSSNWKNIFTCNYYLNRKVYGCVLLLVF